MTALAFGRTGLLYTGHVSGFVRAWELPVDDGEDDEEEEEEEEEAGGGGAAGR